MITMITQPCNFKIRRKADAKEFLDRLLVSGEVTCFSEWDKEMYYVIAKENDCIRIYDKPIVERRNIFFPICEVCNTEDNMNECINMVYKLRKELNKNFKLKRK